MTRKREALGEPESIDSGSLRLWFTAARLAELSLVNRQKMQHKRILKRISEINSLCFPGFACKSDNPAKKRDPMRLTNRITSVILVAYTSDAKCDWHKQQSGPQGQMEKLK